MPSIQMRDVPEPIYRRLADLAEREHRSLAQQTLVILARALNMETDPRARRKRVLAAIAEANLGKHRNLSDPVKLIREDRSL